MTKVDGMICAFFSLKKKKKTKTCLHFRHSINHLLKNELVLYISCVTVNNATSNT